MCSSGSCQGLLLYGTGGCGMAIPPVVRKPVSQQNTFSKLFLVQNKCKEDMGWGAAEAGPATLPRPSDHGDTLGGTVEVSRGAAVPRGLAGPARGRLQCSHQCL